MAPITPAVNGHPSPRETTTEGIELDLLAGLWQEVPFARLPADAPTELREYVVDVDDPRRVYAIHRASRRHDFQMLVDKYIFQIRNGCGAPTCSVSTCFTCRKRLAGKAPVRRYSPLSARTLAVYLASQDNPERGLCPTLRQPREASNAVLNNLIFETKRRDPMFPHEPKRSNSHCSSPSPKCKPRSENGYVRTPKPPCSDRDNQASRGRGSRSSSRDGESSRAQSSKSSEPPNSRFEYDIRERPVNKDYRSFSANLFGTVAFRMLEWLTPQGMNALHNKLDVKDGEPGTTTGSDAGVPGSGSTSPKTDPVNEVTLAPKPSPILRGEPPEKLAPPEAPNSSPRDPTKSKRVPESPFRSPQSAKPGRRASLEPPSPAVIEEQRSPTKSPQLNGFHPEKLARPLRSNSAAASRGIPEIPSKPAFFDNVPSPISCSLDKEKKNPQIPRVEHRELRASHTSESNPSSPTQRESKRQDYDTVMDDSVTEIDCPLPQSLKYINADIVEFVCDMFDNDDTGENPFDAEARQQESCPQPMRNSPLARRSRVHNTISRRQWKAFNEQTLFNVLSDPRSLISSFTADGDLFDSHTLWYCMVRLTRAAPSLVLHSLWMAADSLFVPPKALQEGDSQKTKLFRRNPKALSNFEAGCVMSICLHALAGSAPICPDDKSLEAMSSIRAKGLMLSTFTLEPSGQTVWLREHLGLKLGTFLDSARQPQWLREHFDDAFSNELAIRLARRLCCAVTARRRFAKMVEVDRLIHEQDDALEMDVLDPFFNQIDVFSLEIPPVLEFDDRTRELHERRMQMLTLEWARAVLFNEWDGKPDFATTGPFAGALSLIGSLYEQREILQLNDEQFQTDYFSDRLDSMQVPIEWLSFNSGSQRRHLLDHAYLFSPNTRVSFFRSINFSRMSRTYEESSSLKTRMNAIVDRGSLITNPHHKMVLQDLLKTASSRYLILEISRENVLRDAFDQLWRREERELLRPLKVHLGEEGGEEGFDSGGVQQEFFRMAISEFFHPQHGAFTVDDRTRMAWFAPGSVVELWKFELIGLLVSLAVFNGLTLPVTFPKALYRKLLDWPVAELWHIEDGWPDLASGLQVLQEWDESNGAVEDVFARTYEFSVFTYGSHITREMTTADASWPQVGTETTVEADDDEEAPLVTKENRDEYVSDYVRYLTDVSVRPQFTAFERGFRACLDAKSLGLLSPSILQSLVEGVQEIDVSELRKYTRYVGWDGSHRTVRDFWSIVKRYDEAMKRRLLEFVTASDRLPVGGMRNLQFVVQKNGEEEGEGGHLPTAYTCYGTLLLPEYRDKDVLRERLNMALDNAQGFGFA